MRKKILLSNGCSCSTPSIYPTNWKTGGKSILKKKWYICYYFYDPEFEKPKQVVIKGMNEYSDLEDRRNATKVIYADELRSLKELGYNPFTKRYATPQNRVKGDFHPDLLIIEAFNLAKEKLKCSDKHRNEIKFALNRLEKGVKQLRMTDIQIGKLKRSELKIILEHLNLTDSYFNKFRAYLSSLFNELVEYDCCEINLTRDIRKRKIAKKVRETLEESQVKKIGDYLKVKQPEFYRYMMIFFYSGARSSELLRVKKTDVNLEKQEYKVTIQKGRQYTETIKIILPDALPYWIDIMQEAKANDFLFAKNLKPDPIAILPEQITRRWKLHVKSKLVFKNENIIEKSELKKNDTDFESITADFYSLKHLFLDILDRITTHNSMSVVGSMSNVSSKFASHTTPNITNSVYLVGKKKRENDILKGLKVSLYS